VRSRFFNQIAFPLSILLSWLLPVTRATADGMSPAISLETTWQYIPTDSDVIIWFDMERLRKSELVEPLLALTKVRKEDDRKTFREATGVPIEMMTGLVIAAQSSTEEKGASTLLLRLNRPIGVKELLANVKGKTKPRSEKFGSHDVYTFAEPDSEELCLLTDRLILWTSAGAMQAILTRAKSQPPKFFDKASQKIELSSAICAVIKPSKPRNGDAAVAFDFNVNTVSIQVDVADTVEAKVVFRCPSEAEAEKIEWLAKCVLSEAETSVDVRELAKTTKVATSATNVTATSSAKLELWKKVLKEWRAETSEPKSDSDASAEKSEEE
jgi:hypothetical protein